MQAENYKKVANEIAEEFKTILKKNCYTDFSIVNDDEVIGQVFVLDIFYGEEYIGNDDKVMETVDIVRPILSFQCIGEWKNTSLNINKFFEINSLIFNEFDELAVRGELNSLVPILKKGEALGKPKNIGQAFADTYYFITISSKIIGGDKFLSDLLEESIAVIGLNEEGKEIVEVSCTQNERKNITIYEKELSLELSIPFDKVTKFRSFYKENSEIDIDENYIFVVMSFQNDPMLQDSYETIKRSVNKLKKKLKCERVDEIQDDFIITDKIIDCIKKAVVIIVDLTGNRPNVYYELGFARALGKNVILIAREGEKPHFDISTHNIIFYKNTVALEQALNKRLRVLFKKQ